MAYAETTTVPVARSRAEIEALLQKFKCTQFIVGSDSEARTAMVQFKAQNRIIRFIVPLPDPSDKKYTHGMKRGWSVKRTPAQVQTAVDQAERQRWRALMLVIKAKLESVESQIATFEEEFLAHIVMPNDRTVGQLVTPLIAHAYSNGVMPVGLLGPAAAVSEEA